MHERQGLTLLFLLCVVHLIDAEFELVTFNAGLLSSNVIRHYSERKTALKSALADSSADVVCLQEIWRQQDILDVVFAAQSRFPYHHKFESAGEPGETAPRSAIAPCSILAFGLAYTKCLNVSCVSTLSQGLAAVTACAFTYCKPYVAALGQECLNCMFSINARGMADIAELIQANCLGSPTDNYATTHGLLLLSKHPLKNLRTHTYHPDTVLPITRGYLSAEIDDLGPLVCTHLTTEGAFPNYIGPPPFTTFEELQRNETQQLLQAFTGNGNGHPPVLLGDFNHGPASATLIAEHPANYQLILDAGFKAPYVTEVGNCSLCADNPLAGAAGAKKADRIVDHIYVGNGFDVSGVKRIWDDNRAVNATVEFLPISDHYGVQLTYSRNQDSSHGRVLSATLLVSVALPVFNWLM